MGKIDRIARSVIAIALISAGFYYSIWWLYLIGLLMLLTAILCFCPTYRLMRDSNI